MKHRHAAIALALAVGLSGCASYSTGYRSDVVYRDGSYYSPGDASHGDYYYAPEPAYDYYDYYGQDFFYGSPLYGYGGFCSVRYRYCPPFGYGPFPGYGFGLGNGYVPYGYGWPRDGRHRRRDHDGDHQRDRNRAPPHPTTRLSFPAPSRDRPESRSDQPSPRSDRRSQSDDGAEHRRRSYPRGSQGE
jgi:hypothetical protein